MVDDKRGDARKDEIREFRRKGGAAVGKGDVVHGKLDETAGSSRESPGAAEHVRPKLDEAAKRRP